MEDFLTVYKDFENTIRKETSFVTAKDYEDAQTDSEIQDRLRLARTLRNYFSHHVDGEKLIKIQKPLIDFLKSQKENILSLQLQVKDKYKSISRARYIIRDGDIYTAFMAMSSKEINNAYVVDKDGMLLGEIKFVDLAVFSLENTKPKMQKTDLNKCIIPISKSVKDNLITSKNTLYKDISGYKLVGELTKEGNYKIYGEVSNEQ